MRMRMMEKMKMMTMRRKRRRSRSVSPTGLRSWTRATRAARRPWNSANPRKRTTWKRGGPSPSARQRSRQLQRWRRRLAPRWGQPGSPLPPRHQRRCPRPPTTKPGRESLMPSRRTHHARRRRASGESGGPDDGVREETPPDAASTLQVQVIRVPASQSQTRVCKYDQ